MKRKKCVSITVTVLAVLVFFGCEGINFSPVPRQNPKDPENPVYEGEVTTPAAPALQVISDTEISLSWVDNNENETGYLIERKSSAESDFSELVRTEKDIESWDDSTCAPGTSYTYRLAAFNGTFTSGYSDGVTAATHGPPAAPENLTTDPLYSTILTLVWDDVSETEDGYLVERFFEGSWEEVADLPAGSTSFDDSGLTLDTAYEYRVSGYNQWGSSDPAVLPVTTLPRWTIETIGSSGNDRMSIRTASDGSPRAAYSNGGYLRYASRESGTWEVITDTTYGSVESVVMDLGPDDLPRMAFYRTSGYDHYLYYATWNGSSWSFSLRDSSMGTYDSLSITCDQFGNPYIAYSRDHGYDELYFQMHNGSAWITPERVQYGFEIHYGRYSGIDIDSSGNVHVSYSDWGDGADLRYGYRDSGGSWTLEPVATTGSTYYTAIAVDSNDGVHIAGVATVQYCVQYGYNDGFGWTVETVFDGSTSGDVGIGTDSSGNPHISCYDSSSDVTLYAWKEEGTWNTETVAPCGVGNKSSLAISGDDIVHILFYDQTESKAKYARLNP